MDGVNPPVVNPNPRHYRFADGSIVDVASIELICVSSEDIDGAIHGVLTDVHLRSGQVALLDLSQEEFEGLCGALETWLSWR